MKKKLKLVISYKAADLTIRKKHKSEGLKVVQDSRTNLSRGNVEVGEFSDEEVFKKFYMRGGREENEVETEEYRIENP